jgi:hypothetical protein
LQLNYNDTRTTITLVTKASGLKNLCTALGGCAHALL